MKRARFHNAQAARKAAKRAARWMRRAVRMGIATYRGPGHIREKIEMMRAAAEKQ